MNDLRQAAQQALGVMETNKYTVAELAPHKVVMKFNDAITALRTALAQEHAMHELSRLGQEIEQEPTPWRDMIVATLVREGINKHKARGLADHFAAQPEQEPVAFYHPHKGFYWAKPTHISAPTVVDVPPVPLYVKWIAAQRTWMGLTKVQRDDFADAYGSYQAVCDIEQALKERNNG